MKSTAVSVARALGVHRLLRGGYVRLNRTLRRDARDTEHLSVVLAALLAPDSCVVDVGAHRGDVLADVVRCAPAGRHVAFEPLPDLAAGLRTRFPQVDVRDAALADAAGFETFYRVAGTPGRSGLRLRTAADARSAVALRVRTARLDDELADGYAPTLVKIDVEGAELRVLRGARATIERHRPVIIFEHGRGSAEHFEAGPAAVHDLLTDAGYRLYDMDGAGPLDRSKLAAIFAEGALWSFIARP